LRHDFEKANSTVKHWNVKSIWNRLVRARLPIVLGDGDEAVARATEIADRFIAGNWLDSARPPKTARQLIVASILHVHGAASVTGSPTTVQTVAETVASANPPRDFLRRIRAAERHPYAVAVAIELIDLEELILAQIFHEAQVCLRGVRRGEVAS
jgi:hypothetical protein